MKPSLQAVSPSTLEPPYPPGTRARGFLFELDWELVEQSTTWTLCPAELRPWLLMLWATSWKSSPCGTWPADDTLIAARIGMPDRQFKAHRDQLMRGWKLATDGRLYHDTITELVLKMCSKRVRDAKRTSEWRQNRVLKNQQLGENVPCDSHVSHTPVTRSHTTITTLHSTTPQERNTKTRARKARTGSAKPPGTLVLEDLVADGIPEQFARDWLTVRKGKGLSVLTETAWQTVKAEAAKAGITPAQAVQKAAGMSWAGFRASWPDEDPRRPAAPPSPFEGAK